MLLTEEQAKKKDCSRAPVVMSEYESSRVTRMPRACIASDCMAWRWKADPDPHDAEWNPRKLFVAVGPPRTCDECKGEGCDDCEDGKQQMSAPAGYCGLAGRPEVW